MVEHVLPTFHTLTAVPLGGLLKVMEQVLCCIGPTHVLPRAGHAPFEGHEKAPLCLVLQKHTDSCVPWQRLDSIGGGLRGGKSGEGVDARGVRIWGLRGGWEKEGERGNTNPLR